MNSPLGLRSTALAGVACVAAALGCGGSPVRTNAERLERACGLVVGNPIGEADARCIARLWGVRDTRSCPMQVDRPDTFGQPVFRVREGCTGLGAVIAESTGRVLALVSGDRILD